MPEVLDEEIAAVPEHSEAAEAVPLVFSDGHTNLHYEVGRLGLVDGFSFSSVIAIAVQGGQLLVAVPFESWARKVADRALPPKALSKPLLCSVFACHPEAREEPLEEEFSQRIWVGFLNKELEPSLEFSFPAEFEADYPFVSDSGEAFIPYAESLVEVSAERYQFVTAESGGGGAASASRGERAAGGGDAGRIARLEDGMAELQKSLSSLTSVMRGSLKEMKDRAPSTPARAPALRTPERVRRVNFRGLDGAVVDAALGAGVPEAHLQEMADILSKSPGKMEDLPRRPAKNTEGALSETEEEEPEEVEEELEGGSRPGSSSDTSVAKAIVKLTKVCSHLAQSKRRRDPLEQLLDIGGGSLEGEGSGSVASKKGAALRLLKKRLVENPSMIYKSIESNMLMDYGSQPVKPGEGSGHITARGWLEHRSRIQSFASHVRWSWTMAGVWDALIRGDVDQARARCALAVAAADQSAIDGGSWILAQTMLLETPPPLQSFSSHTSPGPQESQHTSLLESSWVEIFLHHVKEQDSYLEAKRRLSGKGGRREESEKDRSDDKGGKREKGGKPKGTPKGGAKAKSQPHPEGETES